MNSKKNIIKIFLIILILLPIIIGFGYEFYTGDCSKSKETYIRSNIIGTIRKKVIDHKQHNFRKIIFVNGSHYYLTSRIERKIYDTIEIGDSIYKKSNSRILKLIKKDGKVILFKETEPDCNFLFDKDE